MRHEWIFEVLTDLRAYAIANGMPALAAQAETALRVASAEIAASGTKSETGGGGGVPPLGRPN